MENSPRVVKCLIKAHRALRSSRNSRRENERLCLMFLVKWCGTQYAPGILLWVPPKDQRPNSVVSQEILLQWTKTTSKKCSIEQGRLLLVRETVGAQFTYERALKLDIYILFLNGGLQAKNVAARTHRLSEYWIVEHGEAG